ncbi:MAG: type IV pilus modification PilV family protein, partial [Planctomycetota bacterium]
MNSRNAKKGFSLTEVLISIGILSVGILLVAGVFPVALYYSTISTERTIASAIAEEAFSKIQLFAMDPGNIMGGDGGYNINLNRLDVDKHTAIWAVEDKTLPETEDLLAEIKKVLPGLPEDPVPEMEVKRFHAELTYPSHDLIEDESVYNPATYTEDTHVLQKQEYCWSAIMKMFPPEGGVADPNIHRLVQVTVFVCRRGGANVRYHRPDTDDKIHWLPSGVSEDP